MILLVQKQNAHMCMCPSCKTDYATHAMKQTPVHSQPVTPAQEG